MLTHLKSLPLCCRSLVATVAVASVVSGQDGDWRQVYTESFDRLNVGTRTQSEGLPQWEGGSAEGVVFDGGTEAAGRFLVSTSTWSAFNRGPILNLDLTAIPHDRVHIQFDLYTFGDWRGVQRDTGGPAHRLMFFDTKAMPEFAFDSDFSTDPHFKQSWPDRHPSLSHEASMGATSIELDRTGQYADGHRWPVSFEYESESSFMRFSILCGAPVVGSGRPMPPFAIDNVIVSVRSTAPAIELVDRQAELHRAEHDNPKSSGAVIEFEVVQLSESSSAVTTNSVSQATASRVSLGIFNTQSGRLVRTLLSGERFPVGKQSVVWDGLDNRGRPAPVGDYRWRVVTSPGFVARYVTTIGVNPPGGENPVPSHSWVGDHLGGGLVDVDKSGVYIGSPMTENGRTILKCDSAMTHVEWSRPQDYQGGQLTRIAASGEHVYMLHPNGKLWRINRDSGQVTAEWQVGIDGNAAGDMDARGANLVVVSAERNLVRWLSVADGQTLGELHFDAPSAVAVITNEEQGEAFVSSNRDLFRVSAGQTIHKVATLDGSIKAMDYDPQRGELWVVVDGHKIVCLDASLNVIHRYGEREREFGPFDPTQFAGVTDIAADLDGGFFVGEPSHAPRRIAHIARDGSLIDQWFGGMSFYINGTFDPADPSRLYGIAPEGAVNVYRIDFDKGTWQVEACYQTGGLGDNLFPVAGAFKAIRRNNELYLYHRVVPAVVRLDPHLRRAVPVAIAGRVLNAGRTFFQFAGSGREGFPKPWVTAAEHHGYRDLAQAPRLYSWTDSNGNGEFEPEEFCFYSDATRDVSFHGSGDFLENGDYLSPSGINEPRAIVRLPATAWEGPDKAAPRWDWSRADTIGEIIADAYGYGSPRSVSVAPDGSISAAFQAGIMIREHGQYEGGGWPEMNLRGSRILGFNSSFEPTFAVGRQSKDAVEANAGMLYYPLQSTVGPNCSIVVNDQTRQPAQVWTNDGLYIGGFFDQRADDGLDVGFYQVHGDDNQGATVVTALNGRTYWLMPHQGHNRLYEISGWENWHRQTGTVTRPATIASGSDSGTGLTARYYKGRTLMLETTEAPIDFEAFGSERHADRISPHFKAEWSGFIEVPLTDRYRFHTLLGSGEQVAVWIDGRLVHSAGFPDNRSPGTDLVAGHRHRIRVEYINPDGRAELKLLWSSRVMDPIPLNIKRLYPDTAAVRGIE